MTRKANLSNIHDKPNMPLVSHSSYRPPAWLFNGHLQTIVPSAFRRVNGIDYHRERMDTADGDFLDLDWSFAKNPGTDKLVVISHGLEGSSDRHYVKGMVKSFNGIGWDALAWNFRGCSGEMNRLPRFNHHGDTDDLSAVIHHALSKNCYCEMALVGFSMGGSMTLKLLGQQGGQLPPEIRKAVVFSVPCDLTTSVEHLSQPANAFYRRRFLRKLERKIRLKSELMPELVQYRFDDIRVFRDFDTRYTAPLHGFRSADEFYDQASARHYLSEIRIPTLLVNALNDPFLTESCFPIKLAEEHPFLYLEMPRQGGHVGFSLGSRAELWSEKRAVEFVRQPASWNCSL